MNQLFTSIIFVGKICSGKSSLARSLSKKIESPIASFGKYVKEYALKNGQSIERNNLQNLGQSFINDDPENFLKDLIRFTGDSDLIIFEGVRHLVIYNAIKKLSHKSISFYLDVSTDMRFQRFNNRESKSISLTEFLEQDNHQVEKDIDILQPLCDFVINGTQEVDLLVEFIKSKIAS